MTRISDFLFVFSSSYWNIYQSNAASDRLFLCSYQYSHNGCTVNNGVASSDGCVAMLDQKLIDLETFSKKKIQHMIRSAHS